MTLLAMQSPAVAGAKDLAPRGAVGRAMRTLLGQKFAEAFYFMVMASGLRNRAKALGCRYGLESVEMRAETMRYRNASVTGGGSVICQTGGRMDWPWG